MLPRNAHRSFLGGLVISGARPIFVECEMDYPGGCAICEAGKHQGQAEFMFRHKGRLSCKSTYYGTVNEIKEIAELLLEWEIPLMVGKRTAHSFSPGIRGLLSGRGPASVHGLHKTMPVLTQAGILPGSRFSWSDRVQPVMGCLPQPVPPTRLWHLLTSAGPRCKHGRSYWNRQKNEQKDAAAG